jgi:hypothetical protein
MAYTITGRILNVTPTQELISKAGKAFTKRDVVISRIIFDPNTGAPTVDTEDTPIFTLLGSSCSQLDGMFPGAEITIRFELRGRSYEFEGSRRYSTDIRVLNVSAHAHTVDLTAPTASPAAPLPSFEPTPAPVAATPQHPPFGEPFTAPVSPAEFDNDLPF